MTNEAELATELLELGDACLVMDRDWRIVRVNRRQEELSGKSRTQTVGRAFAEVWPELVQPDSRYWGQYERCMRERVPVQFEEYYAPLDLWTDVTAYPVSTGGIAVFFRGVMKRRRAEEALRDSEQRLRFVLENMAEGLVIFDASGNITDQNPASVRIHDRRLSGEHRRFDQLVVNWKVRKYPDGSLVPPEQWAIPRVIRGERVLSERFFVDCIEEPGRSFVGIYSGCPVHDQQGKLSYGFLTIEDITEQARAEAALRDANENLLEADRRKDEFLGMLSHELRNPLAPIRQALYILDQAEPTGPQARRAKDVANRQVAHLTRLVDDLLDVTRIARGKFELRRADIDVAALARRTAEDYQALMLERGLDLVVAVPDTQVIVNADDSRLAQVLGNLLSNAAKFTPAGGRVTLAVQRIDRRVVIHVRDTGPGIKPDLLPAIFEPFVQATQGLARTEGGLGLGLAVVRGIVELHGGTVAATSTSGAGAEFTLELPAAGDAVPSEQIVGEASAATRRYRVLVVDDNHDAADSLAELVRLFGHEVEVAYDGPSAVASAVARRPDAVLCDIGLPGMDGYEVARALRAKLDDNLRLVAVSGYAQPEDVRKSVEAGFDAHVAKPPDPARLKRVLSQCR